MCLKQNIQLKSSPKHFEPLSSKVTQFTKYTCKVSFLFDSDSLILGLHMMQPFHNQVTRYSTCMSMRLEILATCVGWILCEGDGAHRFAFKNPK